MSDKQRQVPESASGYDIVKQSLTSIRNAVCNTFKTTYDLFTFLTASRRKVSETVQPTVRTINTTDQLFDRIMGYQDRLAPMRAYVYLFEGVKSMEADDMWSKLNTILLPTVEDHISEINRRFACDKIVYQLGEGNAEMQEVLRAFNQLKDEINTAIQGKNLPILKVKIDETFAFLPRGQVAKWDDEVDEDSEG